MAITEAMKTAFNNSNFILAMPVAKTSGNDVSIGSRTRQCSQDSVNFVSGDKTIPPAVTSQMSTDLQTFFDL